jgi:hypothetical protein
MSLHPTTDLVTLAWLATLFPDNSGVDLPQENTTWAASGFVQIKTIGGTPGAHFPLRQPVLSVDCWANDPGSDWPPWNKATQLCEQIIAACYLDASKRQVVIGGDYLPAHVQSIYPVSEVRRAPSDVAGYAHTTFDLAVNWVAATGGTA